jgi:hypothetical protein
MHIFLDESGTFVGYQQRSIGVVGALVIPDSNLRRLRRKFARIRPSLLKEGGEVKGRLLGEHDVNRVVRLLATREVIFEVTALDLGLHTEAGILAFRQKLAAETRAKLPTFPEPLRGRVAEAVDCLDTMTPQLFLQALTTFELIHRVIRHAILYFSQRRPYELPSFTWVVDGKDRAKVTNWENWLKFYAQGALISLSQRDPVPMPNPGMPYLFNYTFLDAFMTKQAAGDKNLDTGLLLRNFSFSSHAEEGLEFVDVLTNATRRLLTGKLQHHGLANMHRLMIHRADEAYIKFILLGPGPDVVRAADYAAAVNEGFLKNGRPMFTRRNEGYDQKRQAARVAQPVEPDRSPEAPKFITTADKTRPRTKGAEPQCAAPSVQCVLKSL